MFDSTCSAANVLLLAATVGAGAAVAQQPAPQNASVPTMAASSAVAVAPATPMAYRSAFDGYKGLTEQPVQSWREANDSVGRIGGWKSYAREAQGGLQAGSAAPSIAPATQTPGPVRAPANTLPERAKAPAASASNAMPVDHTGHTKP